MKNWQKKVLAVVLAVALIVTGFATSTFMDGNSNKVVKKKQQFLKQMITSQMWQRQTLYRTRILRLKSLKSLMCLRTKTMWIIR